MVICFQLIWVHTKQGRWFLDFMAMLLSDLKDSYKLSSKIQFCISTSNEWTRVPVAHLLNPHSIPLTLASWPVCKHTSHTHLRPLAILFLLPGMPQISLFCFFIKINSPLNWWPCQYGLSLPHDLKIQSWSHTSFRC